MILFWLVFGLAVLVVILGSIAGIVIHAGHRATEEFEKSKTDTAANVLLSNHVNPAAETHQTSSTFTGNFGYVFHFAPLITDAPDLTEKIRANKDKGNQDYDKILLRVAEYEKIKNELTVEQAKKMILQISADGFGVLYKFKNEFGFTIPSEGLDLFDPRDMPLSGTPGKLREAFVKLYAWQEDAVIEAYARNSEPAVAAYLSEGCLNTRQFEWLKTKNGQQVFKTDYFRERGYDDYYRPIYYYWQSGTFYGYVKILDVVVPHWMDQVNDDLVRKGILGPSRGDAH